MTPIDQARRYVAKQPPAISGAGGHNQTFAVACGLVNGFALPHADALDLLAEYNRGCSPPWSERDLEHKLTSAEQSTHPKPRGHLLGRNGVTYKPRAVPTVCASAEPPMSCRASQAPPKPLPARQYQLSDLAELPPPIPDGARALLKAVFSQGEHVAIVPAEVSEDGSERPKDAGNSAPVEEWLKKLDVHQGDPNGIWSSSRRAGIYVRVNPMAGDGRFDRDVTDFRHVLLEFDSLPVGQQYALYMASGLPCAAIIHSGGKSVHAWVKVEAAGIEEYRDRVAKLYAHFAAYAPDIKNRNPSRLSRLPNCVRFGSRQELLALNVGCKSWGEWEARIEAEALDAVATKRTLADLWAVNTEADTKTLIGVDDHGRTTRYLCAGGSAWLIGPSGVGKSSLAVQLAISGAMGAAVFGMRFTRPMRFLVVQGENDDGDLSEMVKGVCGGVGIDQEFSEVRFAAVNGNVVFLTERCQTGEGFVSWLERMIETNKPDIVMIDPILSFFGIDISRQADVTRFLRTLLSPILDKSGVAIIGVHHTGKPSKDPKANQGRQSSDFAYDGIGSSELVNWARAVMVLRQAGDNLFELKLAKRGKRAQAKHPNGEHTTGVWLKHSETGICWEQVDPPKESQEAKHREPGRPSKAVEAAAVNSHAFIAACPKEGEGKNEISRRYRDWLAKLPTPMIIDSLTTVGKAIVQMAEAGKLRFENGKFFNPKS